jgi:hypothetical protein
LEPIGFWSYANQDDAAPRRRLSHLHELLVIELRGRVGSSAADIFFDRSDIRGGEEWQRRIEEAIQRSSFFIPIITPAFLKSEWCAREVELFRSVERNIGRSDLVFPIHYLDVSSPENFRHEDCVDQETLKYLRTRQWRDFRHLRRLRPEEPEVEAFLELLAVEINARRLARVSPTRSSPVVAPAPISTSNADGTVTPTASDEAAVVAARNDLPPHVPTQASPRAPATSSSTAPAEETVAPAERTPEQGWKLHSILLGSAGILLVGLAAGLYLAPFFANSLGSRPESVATPAQMNAATDRAVSQAKVDWENKASTERDATVKAAVDQAARQAAADQEAAVKAAVNQATRRAALDRDVAVKAAVDQTTRQAAADKDAAIKAAVNQATRQAALDRDAAVKAAVEQAAHQAAADKDAAVKVAVDQATRQAAADRDAAVKAAVDQATRQASVTPPQQATKPQMEQQKTGKQNTSSDSEPTVIGQYQDWTAATEQTAGKLICYAYSDATKSSANAPQKRDPDLMVVRRARDVEEVWLHAGIAYAKNASVTVSVDSTTDLEFSADIEGSLATDTAATISAFKDGTAAVGHSPLPSGEVITDEFSLIGFTAAYTAAVAACASEK